MEEWKGLQIFPKATLEFQKGNSTTGNPFLWVFFSFVDQIIFWKMECVQMLDA